MADEETTMQDEPLPEQLPDLVDQQRRNLLLWALAALPATAMGKAADPMTMISSGKPAGGHLRTQNLGEKPSRIPGFAKITLATLSFLPGDRIDLTMDNPAICQMAEGRLEARRAGEAFVANNGDFWTCNKGDKCQAVNRGPGIAVMRYFMLLPG
jgi:hypothetical protein